MRALCAPCGGDASATQLTAGVLSFADLDGARAGWQAMLPALQSRTDSLQAYALPRAPGG